MSPKCPICGAFLTPISPTWGSQTYGMVPTDYKCKKCEKQERSGV